jgi:hypothetical protein
MPRQIISSVKKEITGILFYEGGARTVRYLVFGTIGYFSWSEFRKSLFLLHEQKI